MNAKFNGRPVRNIALAFIVGVIAVVCCALVLPLHPIFWAFGRKGIVRPVKGSFSLIFDRTSFERA